MSKAIDKEMFAYFMQLNDAEKQSVVELLKTFMKGRKGQSERISKEQYNKDIDEAMEQARKGEYTTFEDLEKEMQSW
jgi:L-lactate utilization protein LutC